MCLVHQYHDTFTVAGFSFQFVLYVLHHHADTFVFDIQIQCVGDGIQHLFAR